MNPDLALSLSTTIKYEIVVGFLIFLLAIILHEYGHLFELYKKDHKPKTCHVIMKSWVSFRICSGSEADYDDLSDAELKNVYVSGMIAGLIPIITGIIFGCWSTLVILPLYVWGCKADFDNMKEIIMKANKPIDNTP